MCGAALNVSAGMTVCECEYCGTAQTLPKLDNEKRNQLFDRANHYRMNKEFDKASVVYENILAEAPDEAEAHWGMCLCRYGIEYVVDPKTNKRIPTCHRTQFRSILEDSDYLAAVKNCDGIARAVYNSEAMYIDNVQKQILEISSKEEPFDIFICYKESDDAGRRTIDSAIAQDIYIGLTNQGYKVFFARITLEDKIGSAYEPYIFAALNSSKIMLVVGTKPEYFSAVWVKNEWSRYLSLIEQGQKKTIIPCYRDMSPYDLPDEFAALQSQDVSKVGYMQDLLRGIEKILGKSAEKTVVKETVIATGNTNTAPLLKRAFLFLEDGDWQNANIYCEKVLDMDPECAEAYFGKLLAELHVNREENLPDIKKDFSEMDNYGKAYRFGDNEFKKKIENYNKQSIYNQAYLTMKNAANDKQFLDAKDIFKQISGFSDADRKAEECQNKAFEFLYNIASDAEAAARSSEEYNSAAREFEKISSYKDSLAKAAECREKAQLAQKEETYQSAMTLQKYDTIGALQEAVQKYNGLGDYKDSPEQKEKCKARIEEINKERKKKKRITLISCTAIGSITAATIAFVIVLNKVIIPNKNYSHAMNLYNSGKYTEAIEAFEDLNGYKDSKDKITESQYQSAVSLMENGDYNGAIDIFEDLNGYKDSKDKLTESQYQSAVSLMENGDYNGAIDIFEVLNGYKDSKDKLKDSKDKLISSLVKLHSSLNGIISSGPYFTVALKSNGAVVAVGYNEYGQCDVSDWSDIVAVSAGFSHTVGLKADGTVMTVGYNGDGQCDVSDWSDIVAISAGRYHTVGLKSDGTVVAVGDNDDGQCNISDWSDIVAVSTGEYHTIGLKSDGTVVAVGRYEEGQCDVSDWSGIVAVSAGALHTVGLKADGTVVAVGYNGDGQCDVSDWSDIAAVSAGYYHTVGLKSDGTVVAVGHNETGQCDVSDWSGIKTTNE